MTLEQMFAELQPDKTRSAEYNRALKHSREAIRAALSELAARHVATDLAYEIAKELDADEAARNG